MLEVCIDSVESAINAIHGGADELEVCSSLIEGGLTPSAGLVKTVLQMVDNVSKGKKLHRTCKDCKCDDNIKLKIPKINVMIRCRAGFDFRYTTFEMDAMLADVDFFKVMNVDRFVFGGLFSNQDIDEPFCSNIITQAKPIPVTFHRAFDVCKDPMKSLRGIIDLGFDRLLTSGQRNSADDPEAIKLIKGILDTYGHEIEIMPGSGVNVENARTFIDMGCKIVHGSCKRGRLVHHVKSSLGIAKLDSSEIYVTDEDIVANIKTAIKSSA